MCTAPVLLLIESTLIVELLILSAVSVNENRMLILLLNGRLISDSVEEISVRKHAYVIFCNISQL